MYGRSLPLPVLMPMESTTFCARLSPASLMSFNLIDVVLVVLVLLSVLNGWRRGFILGLLDLLGWALVLIAGLRFYQPVARWLGAHLALWSEVWNRPLAFIAIAILTGALI